MYIKSILTIICSTWLNISPNIFNWKFIIHTPPPPKKKKTNPLKQGKFNEVHVLQNEDISTISDGYHDNPLAADVELNERKIYKNGTPYTSSDIEKGTKLWH